MVLDKRKLQAAAAAATALLIVLIGLTSGYFAASRLTTAMEQQMAEDSRVISENLRIIISQVTRELTDQGAAIEQVQQVLEKAQTRGWRGFACVVDEDGTVVAHPKPEMRGATVSLETYEPTPLAGPPPDRVFDLPRSETLPPGVYRSSSDIIAVQWLPKLMTYLCVHQPQGEVGARVSRLVGILTRIGALFVLVSAGATWWFVGALVDRYESSLALSEARNRALVQNSEAILVVDDDRIRHANPAALKMLGIPENEADGQPISAYWGGADADGLAEIIRESREGRLPREVEFELHPPGGRVVPVAVRACAVDFGDRQATYLMIRDVTESRRARDEILEANRKLKELDRLKSDFLNTVSHELRTPLTSIKWSTESLAGLDRNWDEATFEKLLTIIRDDNQRLTNLIEQLLSFSRLDAGKLAPRFAPVDLREIAEKAILEMTPIAEARGTQIDLDGDAVTVEADREQVRLILSNLLDNAVKYGPDAGRVEVVVGADGGGGTISVKDCGPGIKEEEFESIFQRFYRGASPEIRDQAGTGLGLAIVKGVVDAHGGTVRVDSRPGEGSTFTVSLPRTRPSDSS